MTNQQRVTGMLTSRANSKLKLIRALRQRKERDATGLFSVEGIAHVAAALEVGAPLEYVCYAPDLLTSPVARELIERHAARGLPCYPVAADVFESISDKEHPAGIIAVARQNRQPLGELIPAIFDFGVALVSPQDPGNVGAILRTIDAVGASGLILLDGGVDVYHPTAVRASLGAVFFEPVASATFDEFADWIRQHCYHLIGTSARTGNDYRAVHYALPLILLMGNEQKGLSDPQKAICSEMARMPMLGKVTSLNLAVATGIMLYEALAKIQSR